MRHFITLDDFSNNELEQIFRLADLMQERSSTWSGFCTGQILAALFYEPSTRTRLSFESAMARLNGSVIGFASANVASVAKGETIADTARMVTNYAELIAVRHQWAGAARVMAHHAQMPVINCGDGSHSHPTQGLIDIYTIKKRKKHIKGLTVGICGDLRYGRAAHSFAIGVARFGGKLIHIAPEGFQMPKWVNTRLKLLYDTEPIESNQLIDMIDQLDVIYVNRLQAERLPPEIDPVVARQSYLLNAQIMRSAKPDAMIMHPLPRVNELAFELDADPRAAYFEQSAHGVPVRMALMTSLLALKNLILIEPPKRLSTIIGDKSLSCANINCVTNKETYLTAEFEELSSDPLTRVCSYCGEFAKRDQNA